MQACCRRSNRAGLPCEHGLVAQFVVAFNGNMVKTTVDGTCTFSGSSTTTKDLGLTATLINPGGSPGLQTLNHATGTGNFWRAQLTVSGCNCKITGVKAFVHNKSSGNACPASVCQQATSSSTALSIFSGGIGPTSTTVTVEPNQTVGLFCPTLALHWGDGATNAGYLVVQLTCA